MFYQKTMKILIILICAGIFLLLPYFFLDLAMKTNSDKQAQLYYNAAKNIAIIPKTKAHACALLSDYYKNLNRNLNLAIKNCEISQKYSKNNMCLLFDLYTIEGDYNKALEALEKESASSFQIKAQIYFLKGDTKSAIDILNQKISKNPTSFDYAYRANMFDYLGNKEQSKEDYKTAYKIKNPDCPDNQIKQMQKNKNYIFDKLKEKRKLYGL